MHLTLDVRRRNKEHGASAAEYALLISLIAGVIFAAVTTLGIRVHGLYNDSCRDVAGAIDGSSC